ncbi:MAG: S66 peptidase family protein [Acidobacteriota bacterium]
MERRSFLTGAAAVAAAALASTMPLEAAPMPAQHHGRRIIKPRALAPGATIGIVAPASNIDKAADLDEAKATLEALGFRCVFGRHVSDKFGYLAGTDKERAEDVNEMFRRKDVDGIIALRGGWGCLRMIPYLDYRMIRRHPKVLMGYSDITTILNAVYLRSGLVTFHGPVALSTYNDYTNEYLKKAVFTPKPVGLVAQPISSDPASTEDTSIVSLGTGKGTGPLVGGNLSLIVTMLGTPYEIDLKGKVLFLEEVGEEPYRVDRMLTHLWITGRLSKLAGLVIGKFTNCVPKKVNPEYPASFTVEEILRDRIRPLGIPAISGVMIGHIKNKVTMPIGVRATVDADKKSLIIRESAVV